MACQTSSSHASTSQASSSQDSYAGNRLTLSRKRKPKFSLGELEILAEEIGQHHKFLFGSQVSRASVARKAAKWAEIFKRINAQGVYQRTLSDIKKRWHDLRRSIKSNMEQTQPAKPLTRVNKRKGKRLKAIEEIVARSLSPNLLHGGENMNALDSESNETSSPGSPPQDDHEEGDEHLEFPEPGVDEEPYTDIWPQEVAEHPEPGETGNLNITHEHTVSARTDNIILQWPEEEVRALDLQVISVDTNSSPALQERKRWSCSDKNVINPSVMPDTVPMTAYQQLMLETSRAKNAIMHTTGKERNRRLATLEHRIHQHEQNQKTILRLISEVARGTFKHYSEMSNLTQAIWRLAKVTSEMRNTALLSRSQQTVANGNTFLPVIPGSSPPIHCLGRRTWLRGSSRLGLRSSSGKHND
ncbi:uncharacterized protein LOC142464671 [Ascaphus truei]|uniref:uncharacterized protein LOC142464671 n=1 Tax=Ascaphus truei TaxID=8439 RepID=UPI003F5A5C42